jgi:hypothetical protein
MIGRYRKLQSDLEYTEHWMTIAHTAENALFDLLDTIERQILLGHATKDLRRAYAGARRAIDKNWDKREEWKRAQK